MRIWKGFISHRIGIKTGMVGTFDVHKRLGISSATELSASKVGLYALGLV